MGERPPTYAIARIDLPSQCTHGWQVRLQRGGVKYAKFFADSTLGSSAVGLVAAQGWRDELVERLDAEDRARVCRSSKRNSSGVVGVSKIRVVSSGVEYYFWQATWSPAPGERKCVRFSIKRYGDKEAFELAVQARVEATGN